MSRGGKREGAGRPSRKLPITKITVYTEIRDKLNDMAKKASIPVVELVYRIVKHKNFDNIVNEVIADNWNEHDHARRLNKETNAIWI